MATAKKKPATKARTAARKPAAAKKRTVRRPSIDDEFTEAYVNAALWSSTDDEGTPLDSQYGLDDISSETLATMVKDCKDFQRKYGHLFEGNESQAGHDFWLTRNGHGAGFWDRPEVYGQRRADALSDAAQKYGEVYLYADGGRVRGNGYGRASRPNGAAKKRTAPKRRTRRNPEVECREPQKRFDRYRSAKVWDGEKWIQLGGCHTGARYVGRAEGAKKRTTISKKVVRQKASRTPSRVKGVRARKRK